MPREDTQFKKGSKRTIEAAKKSKRGVSLVTTLKRKLENNPDIADQLMQALIEHAVDGSPAHMKLAMEYLDGKVTDKVEMTGKDGEALKTVTDIQVSFIDAQSKPTK